MHDPLVARMALALAPIRSGRAVPVDVRGEPAERPAYPRVATLADGTTDAPRDPEAPGRTARRAAASPRQRWQHTPADRADAARHRARLAVAVCTRREAAHKESTR